jgi:pyridoxamine 5'-phosphate oxidase
MLMDKDISRIRREFDGALDEKDLKQNPIDQFGIWFEEALNFNVLDPNAMTLATVSKEGKPSARIVLLKSFDNNGFTLFTNYDSRKGIELLENKNAALVFFWPEVDRQIRIEGEIQKVAKDVSDKYFASRPVGSRIGACISPQSKIIKDREFLETLKAEHELNVRKGKSITRPYNWGGYILAPNVIEFWQGRKNRLHDRFEYKLGNGNWTCNRLAP